MKQNKIPAIPYLIVVAQFAAAKGLRFFTWPEKVNAMQIYESNAKLLN